MVFGGHIGNPAQLRWIGDAAPHAWNNGVGAVLLDIGMDAFIDQARLRIVARFAWPCGHQVIVKRGAAACAAIGRAPFQKAHGLRNTGQVLLANSLAYLAVRIVGRKSGVEEKSVYVGVHLGGWRFIKKKKQK